MSKISVGIIGGGVGGFTTAVALRRIGIEATVYERSPQHREIGAGMMLWANSARVMSEIGLLDQLIPFSGVTDNFLVMEASGDILMEIATGDFEVPSICIPRAKLLSVLVSAFPSEQVKLSHEFESLAQTEKGVTVSFTNGAVANHDLIVGADGLRSRVRRQVFGASEPIYRGYQVWRGIGEAHGMPENTSSETWGRGRRFGILNTAKKGYTWYAAVNFPKSHIDSPNGRKSELLELFSSWHSPICALIESTPEELIVKNGVFDQVLLRKWTKGRVALLGDSAHACTPNLGQGGGMAIEDALVLAKCLDSEDSIDLALRLYEKRRLSRTKHIQQRSRLMGQIAQWENKLVVATREKVTRMLPAAFFEFNLRRTYSYKT